MKNLFNITKEERSRISNLHESAIKKELMMEQPYVVDKSNWDEFSCVMNHPKAKKAQMSDGTTAFYIGNETFYNNGRKRLSDGTMTNYSCSDEIFAKSTTPDSTETQDTLSQTPSKPKQSLYSYVKEAQRLIGMPESEQDGKFGPDTLKALQSFIENLKSGSGKSVENMDITGSVGSSDVA